MNATEQIAVRVDAAVLAQFRALAAAHRRSPGQELTLALEAWIRQQPPAPPPTT